MRPARADHRAVGKAVADAREDVFAGAEHHFRTLEQPAPGALIDERLEVGPPETGVHDIGAARQQGGNLRSELTREEFGELFVDDFDVGVERAHRGDEIEPRILTPGIILIEPGDGAHFGEHLRQIAGGGDVIHHRMGAGAEDVAVAGLLEHAGRAAIDEHGEEFELLGRARDGQAIAAGDIAHYHVDAAALREVAQFGDLLGRAAGLVHIDGGDPRARQPDARKGRGQRAGIDGVDGELGAVLRRDAEMRGGGAGQETDDGDADFAPRAGVLRRRRCRQGGRQKGGEGQSPQGLQGRHGWSPRMRARHLATCGAAPQSPADRSRSSGQSANAARPATT